MSDYALQRKNMVDSQVRPSDITDRRLIRVLGDVAREAFLPAGQRSLAYMDGPLFLPSSDPAEPPRALLPPRTFAKLVDLAAVDPDDVVLDIGCATGYSAAVLSRLAKRVTAVESNARLAEEAQSTLVALGSTTVSVITGDLGHGYPRGAPYNVIVLEGGVPEIPSVLCDQLAEGGRLVAIVSRTSQATVVRRAGQTFGRFEAFDATAPALPGFATPPVFSF